MKNMSDTANTVSVEARNIYAFGKRKARVFDAKLVTAEGTFKATANTKADAVAAVRADAEYVRTAGSLAGYGCKLYPQGKGEWCFELPSGGSMCFGASGLWAAFDRVASDYADHEGCQAFFAAVRACDPVR
jgi:hypothetical protein